MEAEVRCVIRPRKLAVRLGISVSQVYRMERQGRLPARVIVGPGVSGWFSDEIDLWLKQLPRGPRT
jgi:predicted DNA-binding transcriptional regulator AlpA